MKALLYGIGLQFKLDIRSRSMLITCYLVPLIFFFFMGGIFTSIDPNAKETLISSMSIFTITMSALMGLPPALVEIYSTDIKKVYKANNMPIWFGVVTQFISSFIHTFIVCIIIFIISPLVFNAKLPTNLLEYFITLIALLALTLAIGCILGLLMKQQAKLTMVAMMIFLPSIMLSGIMFSAEMLPQLMQYISCIFPATIAFKAMSNFQISYILILFAIFMILCGVISILLKFKTKQ